MKENDNDAWLQKAKREAWKNKGKGGGIFKNQDGRDKSRVFGGKGPGPRCLLFVLVSNVFSSMSLW